MSDKLKRRNQRQCKVIKQLRRNLGYLNNGYQIELNNVQEAIARSDLLAEQLINLEDILDITLQEASVWHQKCLAAEAQRDDWYREVERLTAMVSDQQAQLHTFDQVAAQRAHETELVQQAETVARIAGNRMDALERFYNDLLAGEYDRPGSFPTPGLDPLAEVQEEPLAPWELQAILDAGDVPGEVTFDIAEAVREAKAHLAGDPGLLLNEKTAARVAEVEASHRPLQKKI